MEKIYSRDIAIFELLFIQQALFLSHVTEKETWRTQCSSKIDFDLSPCSHIFMFMLTILIYFIQCLFFSLIQELKSYLHKQMAT